nr:hypothetical protein [Tanacetum cinerariifolium]
MVQKLRAQVKELQSENEHLKSKVVDCTTCQNLQVQVEELKSVNESLNLSVEELSKAHTLAEATSRERDEMINAQCKKIRLLEEQSKIFHKYNDLLASNDVLKQSLETKFKFSKHDTSFEKMIEMIKKDYESNISKIFITSSTFETKNLELLKEMGDKVKYFDEEKKAFETKISKLEQDLAQRVKHFDDLASQNYVSLQKENNDLRTSYNAWKEKYENSCEKVEKENSDLKMHYKRLFDSIKQKKTLFCNIGHECGEVGHWKRNYPQYLAELMKKKNNAASGAGGSGIFVIKLNTILNRSWIYDTGCGTHICNTTQSLRASRKLKPGDFSLYVGNGQCEAVEAIGALYLCLPSGFEIVLNNCHYTPSITRGVNSVSHLYEDGFVNRFVDNTI